MIPLRDSARSPGTPWVTVSLIGVTLAAFVYTVNAGPAASDLVYDWGLVPAQLSVADPGSWLRLITALFLHGGWLHVLGNMLYLWVFGDNVESRLGHGRFLVFYLAGGAVAGLGQVWAEPGSPVPIIGASGAVAAVLGAYLVLYPRSRILSIVPIFAFLTLVEVRATLYLGLWFILQVFNGVASLPSAGDAAQLVAWWAHAAGFTFGALVGLGLRARRPAPFGGDPYSRARG